MPTNTTAIKKRRKLVFDVLMTVNNATATALVNKAFVLCTVPTSFSVFSSTLGIQGDRHSSLLQDYQALTRSASYSARQQRQVRAWFVPSGYLPADAASTKAPVTLAKLTTVLRFVDQSSATAPKMVPPTDTFVTENGFVRRILRGQDATYTRNFQVRIDALYSAPAGAPSGEGTLRGQLYVHRLHSLEI